MAARNAWESVIFQALEDVVTTLGGIRHWLLATVQGYNKAIAPTVGGLDDVGMDRYSQGAV